MGKAKILMGKAIILGKAMINNGKRKDPNSSCY
jgi:hypothetical protein